jgi:hypothetical protein
MFHEGIKKINGSSSWMIKRSDADSKVIPSQSTRLAELNGASNEPFAARRFGGIVNRAVQL